MSTTAKAPQAQAGPFWRDRGLWLQLVIQSAVFFLFGMMDAGNAFSFGATATGWLLLAGYVAVYAGLVVQRWRAESGLVLVAAGLVTAAASLAGVYVLAYLIVCYEAWFISAFVRRRRGLWLSLLTGGSVIVVILISVASAMGRAWGASAVEVEGGVQYTPPDSQVVVMSVVFVLLALISIGLFWQLGMTTRRQHERMAALAARVELAAATERTRIAREMHDIVAHSLTAVIAQADGGRYAGRQDPDKAIAALDTISHTGRDALSQMRQLLSVLRSDAVDEARDTTAPPGVAGMPGLLEDARRSGLEVDHEVLGKPVPVDVAAGLTVYRTVQECLTNILKHAGPTRARVLLDWNAPGKLRITVDNAPGGGFIDAGESGDGQGQGLVGIRERAGIHHGTAQWGVSDVYVGGWKVDVVIGV